MIQSLDIVKERVAILGGGISGLVTAYQLQKLGYQAVVFEAASQPGGMAADFLHRDVRIQQFPHAMLPSDKHLLALLDELSLGHHVRWRGVTSGCYVQGKLRQLASPRDVMSFSGLSLPDRVRTALSLKLLSWRAGGHDLTSYPVETFLRRHFSDSSFRNCWLPVLRAQFGSLYSRIPSDWLWHQVRGEWGRPNHIQASVPLGPGGIISTLEQAIRSGGGEVRRNSPVEWILNERYGVKLKVAGNVERFDAAVSTLSLTELRAIASGPLQEAIPLPQMVYQGALNVALVLTRPVQQNYSNLLCDPRCEFHQMVESSRLAQPEQADGRHVVHLTRYCRPGSDEYLKEDELLGHDAHRALEALFPGDEPRHVSACYVFRAPCAEPVWPLGLPDKHVPARVGQSRVFLCTAAQGYPAQASMNTCIGLARRTADELSNTLRMMPRVMEMANA